MDDGHEYGDFLDKPAGEINASVVRIFLKMHMGDSSVPQLFSSYRHRLSKIEGVENPTNRQVLERIHAASLHTRAKEELRLAGNRIADFLGIDDKADMTDISEYMDGILDAKFTSRNWRFMLRSLDLRVDDYAHVIRTIRNVYGEDAKIGHLLFRIMHGAVPNMGPENRQIASTFGFDEGKMVEELFPYGMSFGEIYAYKTIRMTVETLLKEGGVEYDEEEISVLKRRKKAIKGTTIIKLGELLTGMIILSDDEDSGFYGRRGDIAKAFGYGNADEMTGDIAEDLGYNNPDKLIDFVFSYVKSDGSDNNSKANEPFLSQKYANHRGTVDADFATSGISEDAVSYAVKRIISGGTPEEEITVRQVLDELSSVIYGHETESGASSLKMLYDDGSRAVFKRMTSEKPTTDICITPDGFDINAPYRQRGSWGDSGPGSGSPGSRSMVAGYLSGVFHEHEEPVDYSSILNAVTLAIKKSRKRYGDSGFTNRDIIEAMEMSGIFKGNEDVYSAALGLDCPKSEWLGDEDFVSEIEYFGS